jgi:pimeloyl-ACP methyl ester carboxylesterase
MFILRDDLAAIWPAPEKSKQPPEKSNIKRSSRRSTGGSPPRPVRHPKTAPQLKLPLWTTSAYLVGQDWGSALAFHLAAPRPQFVRGFAFMEFIHPTPSWEDFLQAPAARETFRKFRTAGMGEKMILEDNIFIERVLPGSVIPSSAMTRWHNTARPFPRRNHGVRYGASRTNCRSRAILPTSLLFSKPRMRRWRPRATRSFYLPGTRARWYRRRLRGALRPARQLPAGEPRSRRS